MMKSTSINNLITKLIVLLIGLFFLLPSYKLYTYCTFRYKSVSVYGIVSRPFSGRDIGGRPIVEYKDLHGNTYEIKSKAKTHWLFAPKKGEKIKVFFMEHDPRIAMVDSISYYIYLPLCFIAIGVSIFFSVFRRNRNILNDD